MRHDVIIFRVVRATTSNHAHFGAGIRGCNLGIGKCLPNNDFLAGFKQFRHTDDAL